MTDMFILHWSVECVCVCECVCVSVCLSVGVCVWGRGEGAADPERSLSTSSQ